MERTKRAASSPKAQGQPECGWQATHALSLNANRAYAQLLIDGNRDFSVPRLVGSGLYVVNLAASFDVSKHLQPSLAGSTTSSIAIPESGGFLQADRGRLAGIRAQL